MDFILILIAVVVFILALWALYAVNALPFKSKDRTNFSIGTIPRGLTRKELVLLLMTRAKKMKETHPRVHGQLWLTCGRAQSKWRTLRLRKTCEELADEMIRYGEYYTL